MSQDSCGYSSFALSKGLNLDEELSIVYTHRHTNVQLPYMGVMETLLSENKMARLT